MANEIPNVVKAMITFGLYVDAEDVNQMVTLNQAGVRSARVLRNNLDEAVAIVVQLMEPCAFYVLPELLPVVTAPIPSSQIICTGYQLAQGSDGALPVGVIVPSDAPLDPNSGLTEADRGAVLVQWSLAGVLTVPPFEGAGQWQCTVLDFPNYEGANNHGVPINI